MCVAFGKLKAGFNIFILLAFISSFCYGGEQGVDVGDSIKDIWDPSKYISLNEVRPGMEAYCLTGYRGSKIEKFALEVLSVVRNVRPGRDAILVQGTDERFIHTGPVAGCSGSPVYIEGRLAGALAFGWPFSKDPLYGVTPIEEILRVGQDNGAERSEDETGFMPFDFSKPVDFVEVDRQIRGLFISKQSFANGASALPSPLLTSALPAEVCEQLDASVRPFGLMVVSGIGGGISADNDANARLVPGACLAVPLVTGDITMTIIGTVTEVVDDQVYGFGHSLLGYGRIDLPMATGQVHTVVSNVVRSFKFASPLEIVGSLTTDESAAVRGQIGAEPQMIPLTIRIDRYNDTQERVYDCRIVNNRLLTPLILRVAVAGAAFYLGSLPPDHKIEYRVSIGLKQAEPVMFRNVSTGTGLDEVINEGVGSVALILNNPYEKVDIESLVFDIGVSPKNISSKIWSVDLSDSQVKAGQKINVMVIVESVLGSKKKYHCDFKIPDWLEPGKYDLIVCGGDEYEGFLRRAEPYKFVPQNLSTLIEVMNNILRIERDKLYCLLVLPAGGLAVMRAELPDLPATKMLVLQDAKRALNTQPYPHWLEKSFHTGTVVSDKKVMRITVEE